MRVRDKVKVQSFPFFEQREGTVIQVLNYGAIVDVVDPETLEVQQLYFGNDQLEVI